MKTVDFVKRRGELVATHTHLSQTHEHWKAEARLINLHRSMEPGEAGRDRDLARKLKLHERPIAFICDHDVVVAGDCVAKVYQGLHAFQAFVESKRKGYDRAAARLPWLDNNLRLVAEFLKAPPPEQIRVPRTTWQAFSWALKVMGIDCALTDGLDDEELIEI